MRTAAYNVDVASDRRRRKNVQDTFFVWCALRRTSLKDFKIYINSNSISFFKKNFFTISSHSCSRVLSIIKLLKEVPVTQVR